MCSKSVRGVFLFRILYKILIYQRLLDWSFFLLFFYPQAHRMPCRTASSPSLDLLDLLPLRGSCPSSGISFGWFCLSLSKVSFKSIALREGVAVVAGGGLVTSLVTDRSLFQNLSQGLKPVLFFFFFTFLQKMLSTKQNRALYRRGENQQLKDG